MLQISRQERLLLTHLMVPGGPMPTAQDPDGVYPYESFCETSRRPVLKRYRMIILENDHVRAEICPDLGGKVFSLVHKASTREVLAVQPIVRPIRILPRQAFIGGGIEVSFPISHTPVLLEAVISQHAIVDGRAYAWCGEQEMRFGMQWTVEFSLGEADRFLTQRALFHNPTAAPHPWMSWANAGIPARPDTEFHFPNGQVLSHGDRMEFIDWNTQGPRRQSHLNRMIGFFWRTADCNAFGAFTPSLGCGLYHVADPAQVPGIKLWSDGCGAHEAWVNQYTLDAAQTLEIQAGPLMDQSVKDHLQPGQSRHHVEFWFPTDQPMDIRALVPPAVTLVPPERIPRFGWARDRETSLWLQVQAAHAHRIAAELPPPPDETDNRWAPGGMDALGPALAWAATSATEPLARGRWYLQLGAWHAGRDCIDEALAALEQSADDRAHALAGRLYRRNRKHARAAVEAFHRIATPVIALHPQIVVERDLALAALGRKALPERRRWLDAVQALDDEWVIERRAALLVDEGRFEDARQLLIQTRFQLVHQRYARTRLWKRIKTALSIDTQDPPNWLGEDDLFEFGAYREYGEDVEDVGP
ncbi:MAG: DUF5107 domain-containing protein [Lentisphaerae bacterium]|nr:DUF5107 domain-containing protein [Lentisphaerota bacterium]